MDIKGSVALVTGGASGLGAATAKRLHDLGAKVVILDMNTSKGEALAAELEGVTFVETDVSDEEAVGKAIDTATSQGTLRVAVNCAGVGWAARTIDREGKPHDLNLFKKVVEVNMIGTFNVLRLAASAMSSNNDDGAGRGVIVSTASVAAFEGQIGQIAYAASKGGVVSMTLPAARDLAKVGIRVCAIAPGLFDTPMLATLPEKVRNSLAETVLNPKRLGGPEEYAKLVAAIVENDYLNGEVIRLDGGLRMQPK